MPRATRSAKALPRNSQSPSAGKQQKIIPFYSDREGKRFREFSNFYKDAPPFEFILPIFARQDGLPDKVHCEFSEKAIMAAKAAMMCDEEAFHAISSAKFPKEAKDIGRGVRHFDQDLWSSHLEELAFEVVKQKFDSCKELRSVLVSTGDAILVEAAQNDTIWGVGLSMSDDRIYNPNQWCGQNILGFSLMRARSMLRGETMAPPFCSSGGYKSSNPLGNATMAVDLQEEENSSVVNGCSIDPDETFLRPITDLDAVRACYERYGVVGVTGVLSKDECAALIKDGLEAYLPDGCHMDDPSTYSMADQAVNRYGVVGKEPFFNPAILSVRVHPNVTAAYVAASGREDVYACHDRAAWMRPVALNPSWDTPFSWPGLHFDVSLSNYFKGDRASVDSFLNSIDYDDRKQWVAENNAKHVSMGRTVQGVLNLYDNNEEDGGFHCVPGMFGNALQRWVSRHPALPKPEANGRYEMRDFGVDVEIGAGAVRVPCPAGTMILFDATLPHGTRPNVSAKSRAILFLRCISSDELPSAAWTKRNAALKRVAQQVGFQPTVEQEKHLYGPEEMIIPSTEC